jgi:hypothetical protein
MFYSILIISVPPLSLTLDFVYNCLWAVYSKEELLVTPATLLLVVMVASMCWILSAEIYYTDTDSIYLSIKNPKINCWEAFMARFPIDLQDRYFPKSSTDITPGKMKMEKIVQSLICLAPKTYTYLNIRSKQEIKSGGKTKKRTLDI